MLTCTTEGANQPRRGPRSALFRSAAALALPLLAAACDAEEDRARTIEPARELELVGAGFQWHATSAERFRLRAPVDAAAAASGSGVHWETPPGWTELATSSLRQANFRVAGDERAECYLTTLAGDGGGMLANVNRWRQQMSLAPAEATELAGLPRREFFGGEAVHVDIEGTFTGMEGDLDGAGFRLVGLVLLDSHGAKFLKMVGPKATVDSEVDAFLALARSFHDTGSHAGHGHDEPAPAAASRSPGGLAWKAPAGWRQGSVRPMREVTLFAGTDDLSECYVAVLGGAAGGVFANINRWHDQMGAPQITEEQLANLPRVTVLGQECVLTEVAGSYEGMEGEQVSDALLYGVVCLLPDRAIFVKMIGPRSSMASERDAFLEFCRSLEYAR